MESDKLSDCEVCGGSNFTLTDGLYFCEECGTQNKFAREVIYDVREDFRTKSKVQLAKPVKQTDKKLTSFEEFNFYLIGMLNEILDIDPCSPNIKMTTLQIWMAYLKESEIAFFSPNQPELPKLFVNHTTKDADILYGIKPIKKKRAYKKEEQTLVDEDDFAKKRKMMRKSEFNLSRLENESLKNSSVSGPLSSLSLETLLSTNTQNFRLKMEYSKQSEKILKRLKLANAKEDRRVTVRDLRNPEKVNHITPLLLVAMLYCALKIENCDIQLSDLIRLIREGNISFLDLKHFLPEDHQSDAIKTGFILPSYDYLRVQVTYIANFIPGLMSSICAKPPDMLKLCKRYIKELSLPEDLINFIEKLMAFISPSFKHPGRYQQIHNYEGRAVAYIIFLMKLIFGMDDDREMQMARAARIINMEIKEKNIEGIQTLFDFELWRDFVEYRKMIMSRFYFPLLFSQESSQEIYSSYIGFLESLRLKEFNDDEPSRKCGYKKFEQDMRIRGNAKNILQELIRMHNSESVGSNEVSYVAFKPSLTPYSEYFDYIKECYADQLELDPKILQANNQELSIEGFLKWKPVVEKLQAVGFHVDVQKSKINKNLHIIHRVPKVPCPEYKLSHKITRTKWLKKTKTEAMKKASLDDNSAYNAYKDAVANVLKQRKYWREEIVWKRNEDKKDAEKNVSIKSEDIKLQEDELTDKMNLDTSKPLLPQFYKEPTMLCDLSSDSEFDEEDILQDVEQREEISIVESPEDSPATDDEEKSKPKLSFILPDFNYWNRDFILTDPQRNPARDVHLEDLPKNFQWLLKTCARLLHMNPKLLYVELMVIEYYYLYDLKPLELIDNVLKFQSPKDHKFRLHKQAWNDQMRKRL